MRDVLSRIDSAAAGECGPDQQLIAEVGLEWINLLLRKNADYGSSVWKLPILTPNGDVGSSILVRMSDKIERLRSLFLKGGKSEVEESIEDTMRDLGAYCLLYLARPKPKFEPDITTRKPTDG